MANNVVSMADKRKQKIEAENQAKETAHNIDGVPEELLNQLQLASGQAEHLSDLIDQTLIDFAESFRKENNDDRPDISIPLDALARSFAFTALDLDQQLEREVIQEHLQVRNDIIRSVVSVTDQYTASSKTQVFAHDLYLGLINALIEIIHRFRATSYHLKYASTEDVMKEEIPNGEHQHGSEHGGEEHEPSDH